MRYIDHEALLVIARSRPPTNPTCTVSSFSGWVFNLYRQSAEDAMRHGKAAEFGIEREARQKLRWSDHPLRSEEFQLEFADPLDHSCEPFRISSLTLNGRPLFGVPDVVFRHKPTNQIVIIERKVTYARPAEWPNLKVQLWCYGRIDKWRTARKVLLRGHVYPPQYEFNYATPVGQWHRDHETFDTECRQLFESYGGKVVG
jgi:hypothetical protein